LINYMAGVRTEKMHTFVAIDCRIAPSFPSLGRPFLGRPFDQQRDALLPMLI